MNFDFDGEEDDELDNVPSMTPADIQRYIETGELPKPTAKAFVEPIAESEPLARPKPQKMHFEPGKVHPNVLTVRVLMVLLPLLVVVISCLVIYSTRPH